MLLIFTICLSAPLITLFHELGHALAALGLTKGEVTTYVGSYGDLNNSKKITFRRHTIYLGHNFFGWAKGMCVVHDPNLSIQRNIWIILAGPIFSLTPAIIFAIIISYQSDLDLHNIYGIFGSALVIVLLTILSLTVNVWPSKKPIRLDDGSYLFNDGYQLLELVRYKMLPSVYNEAIEYYNQNDYLNAAKILKEITEKGIRHRFLYKYLISSSIQVKLYEEALNFHLTYIKLYQPDSYDLNLSGFAKAYSGQLQDGISDFNKSLELDARNVYSLNNRGYTYILLGQFEFALKDFNEAIQLEPDDAYQFSNRGLCNIKLSKEEDGLQDIKKAIELDETEPYSYKNLGIYHFDKGEFQIALTLFEKAQSLSPDTHQIKRYLFSTREKLKQ